MNEGQEVSRRVHRRQIEGDFSRRLSGGNVTRQQGLNLSEVLLKHFLNFGFVRGGLDGRVYAEATLSVIDATGDSGGEESPKGVNGSRSFGE
jgi:hypothetical protein